MDCQDTATAANIQGLSRAHNLRTMSPVAKPDEVVNGAEDPSQLEMDDNEEGDDDGAGEAPGTGRQPPASALTIASYEMLRF